MSCDDHTRLNLDSTKMIKIHFEAHVQEPEASDVNFMLGYLDPHMVTSIIKSLLHHENLWCIYTCIYVHYIANHVLFEADNGVSRIGVSYDIYRRHFAMFFVLVEQSIS